MTKETQQPVDHSHLALFAGMGGFIAASNRVGFRTVFANEFESSCVAILRESFPNVPVSPKDIRHLEAGDLRDVLGEVDVLSAGFPCQSFSQAGNNKGFDDDRGKLFFEITRVSGLLDDPPKILLLENVPFLAQFNKGERLSVILNHLRKAGYWVSKSNCFILNSKDIAGSPQNRERLFIVACHSKYFRRNPFASAPANAKKQSELWDLVNRDEKQSDKVYLSEESKYYLMISKSIETHSSDVLHQLRRSFVRPCPQGVCPTLTANMGGGGHNVPFLRDKFGIRRLTSDECLLLQGYLSGEVVFPDHTLESAKLMMIGNSIQVSLCELIFSQIREKLEELKNENRVAISA